MMVLAGWHESAAALGHVITAVEEFLDHAIP
jgi:hypothetical protein